MKARRNMTILLLVCCLALSLFAGCGKQTEAVPETAPDPADGSLQAAQLGEMPEIDAGIWDGIKDKGNGGNTGAETPEPEATGGQEPPANPVSSRDSTLEGISYVMIYNPLIYDENSYSNSATTLTTGSLMGQIEIQSNRAGLEEETGEEGPGAYLVTPKDLAADLPSEEMNREGVRAGLDPVYSRGERKDFYYCDPNLSYRMIDTFTCLYEGDYCYVWSLGSSISAADAASFGQVFDTDIYLQDVTAFGPARFTENGGKINILFYPLVYNPRTGYGIGGFFTTSDIFSSSEYGDAIAASYGLNRDHAIININSAMLQDCRDFLLSTLSHEFQHLICASEAFPEDADFMRSWLNESMSAYAEELIFPGIKEQGGYSIMYYTSERFANGQSLYNFDTDNEDIGAYGAVYLFEEFLREKAGDAVFSNVHDYWRSRKYANEARALASSVPLDYYDALDAKYTFPASTAAAFGDHADEWMSKLTLAYYLEMLHVDRIDWIAAGYTGNKSDVTYYNFLAQTYMLYNQVNPAKIEGGGKIVFAVSNGSYTIPADADDGLIYIGLDKNFNVVSAIGVDIKP